MKRRLSNPWVALSIILIVTAAIYSNIYNTPFVFDDAHQIERNPNIKSLASYFSSIRILSSRPLVGLTFTLNYKFGKLNLFGYHLVNVLIHLVNGFLVYFLAVTILRQMPFLSSKQRNHLAGSGPKVNARRGARRMKALNPKNNNIDIAESTIPLVSLFTALIFVTHPIQTQAVTYTVQRYASMAAMFYFLSVLFYVKARTLQLGRCIVGPHGPTRGSGGKIARQGASGKFHSTKKSGNWVRLEAKGGGQKKGIKGQGSEVKRGFNFKLSGCFALCLICGVLAFLSKQNTASLPGVILLAEYILFDRTWQGWKRKILWFTPALIFLGVFILYESGFFSGGVDLKGLLEDVSGLMRETHRVSRWSYLCTQFNVLVIYIRLLFVPIGQNLDHLYAFKNGFFDGYTWLAFIFLVGIVGLGVWNIKKRPVISLGIFWFFITLSVESSIIPISDAMFEHRLYLPMFGFALVVAFLLFHWLSMRQSWIVGIPFVIVIALGTATFLRNRVWQSDITLWSDVVSKNPLNHRGHNNLGEALGHRGRLKEGIRHYVEALRLKPDYAHAHNNLGSALIRNGNYDKAIAHLIKAVRMGPRLIDAYNNLGVAMAAKGRPQEAIRWLSDALRIAPEFAGAHNSLGNVLAQEGRQEEAIWHWSEALRIKPDYAEAHYNLGIAKFRRGALNEAAKHFSGAIGGKPDYAEAYSKLGVIMTRQGYFDGARRHFQKALEIKPGLREARRGLEMNLKARGRRWD